MLGPTRPTLTDLMTSQRPRDLVFTLFGEYLLQQPEPTWVGSLIALLRPLGLSEGATRTILSRMTRRGWLQKERRGRNAYYDLTARGRRLLEDGVERIYHTSWDAPWDGSWLLLAYSIPEDQRHVRDRLRSRLTWLGFGSLGNGLWINPHHVEQRVEETAAEMGISDHIEVFRGHRVGVDDQAALVAKCWDLPAVNARYRAFVDRWTAHMERYERSGCENLNGELCYTMRFRLANEFQSFPKEDPYLPRPLLPDDWVGDRAAATFRSIHDRLVGPADAYVARIVAQSPDN